MLLKEIFKLITPRGTIIRNEDIYNYYGTIPVYSGATDGSFGYFNKSNFIALDESGVIVNKLCQTYKKFSTILACKRYQ